MTTPNLLQRKRLGKIAVGIGAVLLLAVLGIRVKDSMQAGAISGVPAARPTMPADRWIGPKITPEEYLSSNTGLYVLDAQGILATLYRDRAEQTDARKEYNPAFIANYAISACRSYVKTRDEKALETFRKQLDWLLAHGENRTLGDIAARLYPYTFDWVKFDLKAPWVSGFAQSLIGVAFACGADATGEDKYRQGAVAAFSALRIPVSNGGVATFSKDGAWFEEAAKQNFPSIKILNGHLTAAEGLKNFIDWQPNPVFRELWEKGALAVAENIAEFDSEYMSYYAQYPVERKDSWELSGRIGYNALHSIQLTSLYAETGNPIFLEYALRFAAYETPDLLVTTAGATAPDTNGPDRINMVLGNDYWSHGTFPTWVKIDLGDIYRVRGLHLVAHTDASAPRAYAIATSLDDRSYKNAVGRSDNVATRITEKWPEKKARYIRINIDSDNGNQNVTLKGVYPIRKEAYGAVVATPESMTVRNMPALGLSENGWSAPAKGWIAFRRDAIPRFVKRVEFSPAIEGKVSVRSSQSLDDLPASPAMEFSCRKAEEKCVLDLTRVQGGFVHVAWEMPGAVKPLVLRLR